MATFQVNKQKNSNSKNNVKKIVGWVLLALSTLVFLFSATSLIPALQYFFLGILGIFVYPLTVLGFIVSLALLNNKKYVMPKRYAIFLGLSLILFLAIIQLIIIGSPSELSYGQFLALNYTKQITAGGMLIGFLPATLAYLMGLPATYVVLAIALVACVAFFVEAVISLRKTNNEQKPIRLQIKEKKENREIENPRVKSNRYQELFHREEAIENNVMFNGNRVEEEKRELSAREKLGLVGKGYNSKYRNEEISQTNQDSQFNNFNNTIKFPEEAQNGKVPEGMSIREYLLQPPKVDIEKFMQQRPKQHQVAVQNTSSRDYVANNSQANNVPNNNVTINEINRNIDALKNNDEVKPSSYVHEENYDFSQEQSLRRGSLPDVKPEEITNEAEDIIRSVVKQEKIEREEDAAINNISQPSQSSQQNNAFNRTTNSFDRDSNNIYDRTASIEDNSIKSDDNKDYIDYSSVEDDDGGDINVDESVTPNRDNLLSRERNNISRERDSILSHERNIERREEQPLERNNNKFDISRDKEFNRNEQNSQRIEPQKKPVDEIERRKRFVQLDDEKPQEKIKPYKYTRPSLDLITTKSDDLSIIGDEIPMKRVALENALEKFGVPAKVQNVVIGPTVTRYEIEMPEGISVKRVLSLDADIAYALSANGQIRIEAPIPGRSIVGIEVPNSKVAKVSIKDVLQSKEFQLSPSPLTFALGKDITGNVKVCNLQKMPHLLVAGTTGSGKSVCLNSIIVSILYKASPDEVKFIMIDPKQVELSMYEGLPHMVIPRVITDPTKAVNALQWAVDEMERRFKLISEERVRNIGEYNKLDKVVQNKVKKMPYLVIIFDEFADFMAVAKNEIEDKIRRIAQKARAAGIHLILATQRPSTDVVTGTLKGNLPARIAFKVASRVDSEVILGSTGAEKLLGYGDMLYKPADAEPSRLQGCFIDTPETKDIVTFITENNEEIFDEEANNAINNPNKATNGGGDKDGVDPLLPNALKICIDNGVASTTMVQRKLAIGYPRAARIVDQMEERGYISSAEGSKQRSVYITIDEFYSIFGDIYD